jgi:hypothetical protein
MFWKRKQVAAVPVSPGATTAATPPAIKVEATPHKRVEKPKVEKLSGPRQIPGVVEKYLISEYKMDTDIVRILKSVIRRRPQAERAFDCRIFDEAEAEANEVKINDYNTLNQYPDLILYEGWFDEDSKRVELKEKKKVNYNVPLFTEAEILRKIQALSESSSTVFFYQSSGPAVGGPLGRGTAVVQLNPNYPGKKAKKYIIYTTNVVGMEPSAKCNKLFDSDKPKEIANWVAQGHHKRMY